MVDFINEIIWACYFLFGRLLIVGFNFFHGYIFFNRYLFRLPISIWMSTVRIQYGWMSILVFIFQASPFSIFNNWSITLQVFLLVDWSSSSFSSQLDVSAVFACFFSLHGSGFPWNLFSLGTQMRCWFSVCSAFSCEDQSDDV